MTQARHQAPDTAASAVTAAGEAAAQPFQPFAGLRVIDLTRVLAGPYCSYLLGLLGAEVIKVEPPGRGETIRRRAGGDPALAEAGVSVAWSTQSSNKRCITLDLDRPRGQALLRELAAGADVLVHNLRTGSAEKRGIGYAQLSEINPKLIYCAITAYGGNGPRATHPAYDSVIQAVSGLMSLTGQPDGDPLKVGPPVIDYVTGMNAALAVVCALFERTRSGRGRSIDLAMLDSNFALMTSALTLFVNTGRQPARPGNDAASRAPASTTYRVSDGQFAIAINEEHQYVHLFQSMGRAQPEHPGAACRTAAGVRDQHLGALGEGAERSRCARRAGEFARRGDRASAVRRARAVPAGVVPGRWRPRADAAAVGTVRSRRRSRLDPVGAASGRCGYRCGARRTRRRGGRTGATEG
jgi:crotonobetainyl-CoA:carnitine CoA-transferase CaiB-like acyl-CoA transferase